jgi:hypothetical protein
MATTTRGKGKAARPYLPLGTLICNPCHNDHSVIRIECEQRRMFVSCFHPPLRPCLVSVSATGSTFLPDLTRDGDRTDAMMFLSRDTSGLPHAGGFGDGSDETGCLRITHCPAYEDVGGVDILPIIGAIPSTADGDDRTVHGDTTIDSFRT